MLIDSLAIMFALAQAPAAEPTMESEARRLGVPPLTLRRALRATSQRERLSVEDPLYCFEDRLSVPSQSRMICHTRVQWQNAGFEPILP